MATILLVDDERDLCTMVTDVLALEGHTVQATTSSLEAWDLVQHRAFDLALVDIWLPDLNGIELLGRMKELAPQMPVIIITCQPAYETAVLALRGGARDYIAKPFAVEHLRATVQRVLEEDGRPAQIQAGEVLIDVAARKAWRAGHPLELTATEFEILAYMAQRPGQAVTHEELLNQIWCYSPEAGGQEQIRTAIHRLRQKLERDPARPRILVTVRGVGYRLEVPAGVGDRSFTVKL